jgi:myxalamid-type polyketide synthase MxaB
VGGLPWVNLVVYLELAFASARETLGGESFRVSRLSLPRGLVLSDSQQRLVHTVLVPQNDGGFEVRVLSQKANLDDDPWRLHADGFVEVALPIEASTTLDEAKAVLDSSPSQDSREFYDRLARLGVQLGPACQWLDRVWRGEGQALGRLALGHQNPESAILPLGLVDSCFQLFAELLPDEAPRDYLLSGLESFTFLAGEAQEPLWCHAILESHEDGYQSIQGSLALFANDGKLVAAVDHAVLKRAGEDALKEQVVEKRGRPRIEFDLDFYRLAEPSEQKRLLRDYLTAELSATTGTPVERISMDASLSDQLDSLLAIELKTRIESNLAIQVPLTAFLDCGDVNDVAECLYGLLESPGAEVKAVVNLTLDQMLEDIEVLSDDDALERMESVGGRKDG